MRVEASNSFRTSPFCSFVRSDKRLLVLTLGCLGAIAALFLLYRRDHRFRTTPEFWNYYDSELKIYRFNFPSEDHDLGKRALTILRMNNPPCEFDHIFMKSCDSLNAPTWFSEVSRDYIDYLKTKKILCILINKKREVTVSNDFYFRTNNSPNQRELVKEGHVTYVGLNYINSPETNPKIFLRVISMKPGPIILEDDSKA